jgi:hypothetical protein
MRYATARRALLADQPTCAVASQTPALLAARKRNTLVLLELRRRGSK